MLYRLFELSIRVARKFYKDGETTRYDGDVEKE